MLKNVANLGGVRHDTIPHGITIRRCISDIKNTARHPPVRHVQIQKKAIDHTIIILDCTAAERKPKPNFDPQKVLFSSSPRLASGN